MEFNYIQFGVLSISIAMLLVLIVTLIYLIRWKVAFTIRNETQTFQLVPDGIVNDNLRAFSQLKKRLAAYEKQQVTIAQSTVEAQKQIAESLIASDEATRNEQKRTFDALQAVLGGVKDLRDETQILRKEIQTQALELERHRAGYDIDILSASLIPVARMHRMLVSDLTQPGLSEDARESLIALEDEHLGILETRGVKLVHPPIGERYRDQKNIKHPPTIEPAPNSELAGTIKAIASPSYELETSARNVVLLEAEVIVYSATEAAEQGHVLHEESDKED